jgi:hypothetical protein
MFTRYRLMACHKSNPDELACLSRAIKALLLPAGACNNGAVCNGGGVGKYWVVDTVTQAGPQYETAMMVRATIMLE